jgi:integrase/recombinase XerD
MQATLGQPTPVLGLTVARACRHQTALPIAYGTGLRVSEIVALKVGDIDSERMTLRIDQGKGSKDRYAMLSPILLQQLRAWWRYAHAHFQIVLHTRNAQAELCDF